MLDGGGYDPTGFLVEVYDDSQPAAWIQVLTKEALPSGSRIVLMRVGSIHGGEDYVDVVQQDRVTLGEVQVRTGIEDDPATFGVLCFAEHMGLRAGAPRIYPLRVV
jgi:hypothetical protein